MSNRINRRRFLQNAAGMGAGVLMAGAMPRAWSASPNEKLNIGIVGSASRGMANLGGVRNENIVSLCDVNAKNLEAAAALFPKAKHYVDWRDMIDDKEIDAVVVSTTDHTHSIISVNAMRAGKHVYCEKPLGVTVEEARLMRAVALETKLATQQGTQAHATTNFHKVAKMIQDGAIGAVSEAHVWCTREGGGWDRPQGDHPVPDYLDWNLWLGPAPERPYHPDYFPGCGMWNKYWDFGDGTLGDMGSHLVDFPFTALNLKHPTAVEAEGDPLNQETYPKWLRVRWDHPADGDRAAVKVFWYDGIQRPKTPELVNTEDWHGILYVGEKGMLWANYGGYVLLPVEDPATFEPPMPIVPTAEDTQSHYDEWILACKTGSPTACNFDRAGLLIEHNMLGTVAFLAGGKITWDHEKMTTNVPEADQLLRRAYRSGWELPA